MTSKSINNTLLNHFIVKTKLNHPTLWRIMALYSGIEMSTILNCKDFDNFSDLIESIGTILRDTGAFVIRNVVGEKQALLYKEQVLEYINDNDGNIGFPEDNPQVYEIYWSKPQMNARQHPNVSIYIYI